MKKIYNSLFISLIILGLSCSVVFANETNSWISKVKNFFNPSEPTVVAQPTKTKETVEATKPEWKPTFDFSEKTIGDRHAPIKINFFTSLTCSHCASAHSQFLPYIIKKYVDKGEALIILTDFPLDSRAMTGSLVAHCLKGDAYFAFIDTLYQNQRKWAYSGNLQDVLEPYAKLAGLSKEQMLACATNEEGLKELTRQRNLTVMQHKIRATPTIIIQYGQEKKVLQGLPTRPEFDKAIKDIQRIKPIEKKPSDQPKPLKAKPSGFKPKA